MDIGDAIKEAGDSIGIGCMMIMIGMMFFGSCTRMCAPRESAPVSKIEDNR